LTQLEDLITVGADDLGEYVPPRKVGELVIARSTQPYSTLLSFFHQWNQLGGALLASIDVNTIADIGPSCRVSGQFFSFCNVSR
jgi:hypothetical protein